MTFTRVNARLFLSDMWSASSSVNSSFVLVGTDQSQVLPLFRPPTVTCNIRCNGVILAWRTIGRACINMGVIKVFVSPQYSNVFFLYDNVSFRLAAPVFSWRSSVISALSRSSSRFTDSPAAKSHLAPFTLEHVSSENHVSAVHSNARIPFLYSTLLSNEPVQRRYARGNERRLDQSCDD